MTKWQSKLFPKLILTEEHYNVMRERLPYIESFEKELEALELWLDSHPQRIPKSNWKAQVTNWMRIANEKAEYKQHFNQPATRQTVKQHKEVQIECHSCGRIHGANDQCSEGNIEDNIHSGSSEGTERPGRGLRKRKDGARHISEVLGEVRRPGTNQSLFGEDL